MAIEAGVRFEQVRDQLTASRRALIAVTRSPDLRRVQLAYIGYNVAEWASFIAVSVYAFELAGPRGLGLLAVVQLVPSALVAPFAAVLGDGFPRERMLQIAYAIEVIAVGAITAAMLLGAPPWVVYVVAGAVAVSFTLVRPLHESLIPLLARSPSETMAGYVVASMIAKASAVIGPLLAALIMVFAGPAEVYAVLTLILLAATLVVLRLTVRTEPASKFDGTTRLASEALRGFQLMVSDPKPRVLVIMMGAGKVVLGFLDIMIVVLAFDVFMSGDSGTGLLSSAFGVGGILGAIATVSLIGKDHLASIARNGMLLYGVPIALIAFVDVQSAAFVALIVSGLGSALIDVAGRVMLQRVAPNEALSRVFGVLESAYMTGEALGAVVAAAVTAAFGTTAALMVSGFFLPVLWVAIRRPLDTADVGIAVAPEYLELLHALPMFEALGPAELERIAQQLTLVRAATGTGVIIEGEEGDQFFVITDGSVAVTKENRQLATLGRGEYFGEIALLRDMPRTATVTATSDLELLAMDRVNFVEAIVPFSSTACTTEEFINQRLAAQ